MLLDDLLLNLKSRFIQPGTRMASTRESQASSESSSEYAFFTPLAWIMVSKAVDTASFAPCGSSLWAKRQHSPRTMLRDSP